jgi:hypothetical protein
MESFRFADDPGVAAADPPENALNCLASRNASQIRPGEGFESARGVAVGNCKPAGLMGYAGWNRQGTESFLTSNTLMGKLDGKTAVFHGVSIL